MKSAERRALDTGEVFSAQTKAQLKALPDEELKFKGKKCRAFNFLAPIILVAVLTVTTEDLLIGVFAALALCFVMYLPQRLMSVREYFNNIMAGLADMFSMLVIIILSYTLIEVNGQLGLVQFVVDIALKLSIRHCCLQLFSSSSAYCPLPQAVFWGLAAIAFPIVGPLAAALGVNPLLCGGALISAVAFGGHICLYSDTVILTSASTQVTNAEYFRTSAPLVGVPFVLAAIGFVIMGFAL